MYETYWNLTGKPFLQRSEPARFYRSKSHQAALLRLTYGLDNLSGPGLVLGLSGTGKSSLVRVFAEGRPTQRPFIHIVFPALDGDDLLRLIAAELNAQSSSDTGSDAVLREIHQSLRKYTALGCQPLICFDDAHLLSDDALQEVVQPLLNLAETDEKARLSVLLVGQPVLSSKIRKHSQLSERIAVTTPLQGFSAAETADYVAVCLNNAAGRSDIFTPGAVQRLFEVTAGNPRRINRLGDMALLVGYADQLPQITESQIDAVSTELMPAAA